MRFRFIVDSFPLGQAGQQPVGELARLPGLEASGEGRDEALAHRGAGGGERGARELLDERLQSPQPRLRRRLQAVQKLRPARGAPGFGLVLRDFSIQTEGERVWVGMPQGLFIYHPMDLTWTGQHERICQLSDVLLCIGLSCGTLSEIAWTKWVGNTPVVVLRSLVSGIPPEMAAETELLWVEDLEAFYRWIKRPAGIRS
jgi:hypothetical protein